MRELTSRQAAVLAYVCKHRAEHQIPPTRVEIAREFGFRSPNAAEDHLQALARKGFIRLASNGCARNIFVLREAPHGV